MAKLKSILKKEVQDFIDANINADITRIILSKSPFADVDSKTLAQQIEAKRKAKSKLPTWFKSQKIIYPKNINLQQSSSELTANYKLKQIKGQRIADLTGGFGIDTFAFSQSFSKVDHVERNSELSEIVQQNMASLNVNNVECHTTTAQEFLSTQQDKFDYLFIDPSRRDASQNKVFRLQDCEPDLTKELHFYLSKSEKVYIKTSPLLDLDLGIQQLKNVESIAIVAVQNEVKELLWLVGQESLKDINIKTVNIKTNGTQESFDFNWSDKSIEFSNYAEPQKDSYLYEPNASIMKSGAFQHISKYFNLKKLEVNSHLYASSEKNQNFPGRVFKINQILDYKPKLIKKELGGEKLNLSARNFPIKVEDFKKKYKIKDGGKTYVFLTTTISQRKIILICDKIN
ncbi:MAG: THUMP-like domain-containing protein [Psychroflexus sp.]|uniref:class I SAM-dependent methyltransferase n=1 Tax=Psychroflexus sp. S27 TaxID=1982757 RepID=UPI000C29FF8E|nr:RsmD family RNA methyltransferase [Psychroflexus sp. S27]PJX20705.1 hypothetical protein CAP47_10695 [Psychroflexus sp. S27]